MAPLYKLTYFNVTTLGEPIRFLFAYGGIDYEDVRIEPEEWPAIKPRMPFGQIPILEANGKVYNQSLAITRYVAKLVKLTGKDDLEAMEIDAMADNVNDLRLKIMDYAYETDATIKKKKRNPLINETMPYLLDKLEEAAKSNNGHLVLGKLTWVDIYFAGLIDYLQFMLGFNFIVKYPNLQKVEANVCALPAIKAWLEKRPKTGHFWPPGCSP